MGQAHWFFGNLYEAVVDVPGLLAARPGPQPLLGAGSPVRYYVPAAPLTLVATGVAVVQGWQDGADRRVLVTAALGTSSAAVVTAHLVPAVNLRLLREGSGLPDADRRRLVSRWHAVNLVRLAGLAAAAGALRALDRSSG